MLLRRLTWITDLTVIILLSLSRRLTHSVNTLPCDDESVLSLLLLFPSSTDSYIIEVPSLLSAVCAPVSRVRVKWALEINHHRSYACTLCDSYCSWARVWMYLNVSERKTSLSGRRFVSLIKSILKKVIQSDWSYGCTECFNCCLLHTQSLEYEFWVKFMFNMIGYTTHKNWTVVWKSINDKTNNTTQINQNQKKDFHFIFHSKLWEQ